MDYAPGMEEAIRIQEGFADPAQAAAFWSVGAAEVATQDLGYAGAARQSQRLRLYRGGGRDALTVIYIHGGGWAEGSIELHDYSARGLAVEGACNVASISYRLAPADPFPAGLEDCRAAARWLRANAGGLDVNGEALAIGGASAGANLAIASALADPGTFAGLVLFYGVFGADLDTASYRAYAEGFGLTRARMGDLWDMYDPGGVRHTDPLMTPILSDRLSALPPACVIAAQHDVLLDDSRAMAAALTGAGVSTDFHVEPGVTHGFINRGRLVPSADAAIARAATFLRGLGN